MPCIQIIISPQGESVVTTTGFAGPACRAASEFLERTLGETRQEQLTAEFHQTATAAEHIHAASDGTSTAGSG